MTGPEPPRSGDERALLWRRDPAKAGLTRLQKLAVGVGMAGFAAYVVLLIALSGPTLATASVAPPGRAAELRELRNWLGAVGSYRLSLAPGVALALTCSYRGPCEQLTVVSDDPTVAEVRTAFLGALDRRASRSLEAAFVVVAKKPGAARVHLSSLDGQRDIAVSVAAPTAAVSK